MRENNEYRTTAQLADMIHVQPQTLRKWRITGSGPRFIRLGGKYGRVLYRLADVESWLSSQMRRSTADER